MRIACFGFGALFLFGAAVQWNDPDPFAWIGAYLAGAALSIHAGRGGRAFVANALAAAVFAVGFASLATTLPGAPEEAFTSVRMQSADHEEPREAVGLALLAGWCGVLAVRARRRPAGAD
ncbi:MAG: transmembrane 220 family protein [Myxococcota bacterium]